MCAAAAVGEDGGEEGGDDDSEDWEDCTDVDSDEEDDEDQWKIGLVEAPKIPEALNAEFFPSKVCVPPCCVPGPRAARCPPASGAAGPDEGAMRALECF